MAIDVTNPRWRDVVPYFRTLPLLEKRCFFAKALKFMLDMKDWDEELRDPTDADHENMRDMLLAFNDQKHDTMQRRASRDVQLQWQSVGRIKRGKKRRVRKRQISRITYEYMQLIRICHPVSGVRGRKERNRVKCMGQLQREVKAKFLSRGGGS